MTTPSDSLPESVPLQHPLLEADGLTKPDSLPPHTSSQAQPCTEVALKPTEISRFSNYLEIYLDVIEILTDEVTPATSTSIGTAQTVVKVRSFLRNYPPIAAKLLLLKPDRISTVTLDAPLFDLEIEDIPISPEGLATINLASDVKLLRYVKVTMDAGEREFELLCMRSTWQQPSTMQDWISLTVHRSSKQWIFTAKNSTTEVPTRVFDVTLSFGLPLALVSATDTSASDQFPVLNTSLLSGSASLDRNKCICSWNIGSVSYDRSYTMTLTVADKWIPHFVEHFSSSSLMASCSFGSPTHSLGIRIMCLNHAEALSLPDPWSMANSIPFPNAWVRYLINSGPNYHIPITPIASPPRSKWFGFGSKS